MAISSKSNVVIYDAEFSAGFLETIDQATEELSNGLNGAFNIVTAESMGDYRKQRFFDFPQSSYTRRNITDTSTTLTPSGLTQGEVIGPKLSRRFGPFQMTEDQFRRIGEDPEYASMLLGQNYGQQRVKEMVNTAMTSLTQALVTEASNYLNVAGEGTNKTLDHTVLVRLKREFGDAANRIVSWATTSGAMLDLEVAQLSVGSGNVADFQVYEGGTGTLGIPMFVSDVPGWTVSGTPGDFYVVGLVRDAVTIFVDTLPIIGVDRVFLKENLERVIQGEDDYVLQLKLMQWGGGVNPTDAALATGSNWTFQGYNYKDLPGCVAKVDQS